MSGVRVLVGTRKGAFILTSDGKREKWDVTGPLFGGWEIYHMKGSPVDPEPHLRLADQRLVRADHPALRRRRQDLAPARNAARRADHDAGGHAQGREQQVRLRHVAGNRQAAHHAPVVRRHAASVGVQARLAPRAVADRSGHRLRRASKTRRCSARPTAARPGTSWPACAARHRAASGSPAPAAWGCTRSSSTRANPKRIFIAISAAGAFRTDDGGKTWKPINRGLQVAVHSRPERRGRPLRPPHRACTRHGRTRCSCRCTGTCMRTDDAGDNWHEVSGNLPTDFGFPIDVHAHEPETVYVVPITSDSLHYPPEGKLRVYRSRTGGNEWEPLTKGLPQENCYVNVLRDAMAVDSLDECGIYFGTTGGQVYCFARRRRQLDADRPRSAGRAVRRGADAAMIRVVLPVSPADAGPRRRRSDARSRGRRSRSARSSTRWKPAIRCCAARSATTSRSSAGRCCGSSPARKTSRTNRPTPRCPTRSPRGRSRSGSSAPSRAASTSPGMRFAFVSLSPRLCGGRGLG